MNPSDIVFPTPAVELRLRRATAEPDIALDEARAMLMAAQYQLAEDTAMLRQREDNLRVYERRLRGLQARLEGGEPAPAAAPNPAGREPAAMDPALNAAWSKLHRARELMEVEQKHLIEGRLLLREETQALVRREAAVTVREARVAEAEAQHQARTAAEKPGAVRGLTRAPFALAKAVFTKA
jgi:hypothetical protein